MKNQRKHKRFTLRLIDIESKVTLAGSVDIVDMSLGGVLVRTGGKLPIGRERTVQFVYGGVTYTVKGLVVRSEMCRIEERSPDESVTLYLVGIMFKDESADTVKALLAAIEENKKVEVPSNVNWRFRDVRFNFTAPDETVLEFPAQFTIRDISRSGFIIRTEEPLDPDCMILLELSIDAIAPVRFMGRVVSCRASGEQCQEEFIIGVEFSDLTDRAMEVLQLFRESLKNDEGCPPGAPTTQ